VSDSEGFEYSCHFGRDDVFNCGLFNDYVSFSEYVTCRVVGLCVNKGSANPTSVKGLGITTRNIRIVGMSVGVRTLYLPNASQKRYCVNKLAG
jgi:hypothetical protein